MKIINKIYITNKCICLGNEKYNYKIKSLFFKKLYSNFIYDYEQSFFFIKKSIQLIVDNLKSRNVILIYSKNNFLFKPFLKLNTMLNINNILYFGENWVPGTLSNFKQFRKYTTFRILKFPALVISLSGEDIENLDVLKEASHLSIPVVTFFSGELPQDNLAYPIIGDSKLNCFFYEFLFYNCIIYIKFLEKLKIRYPKIIKHYLKNKKIKV